MQGPRFDGDLRCVAAVTSGREVSAWCGERSGALTVRDPDTAAIRTMLPQEKLAQDYVWCILQVEEGSVWVGTSSGRMRIYSPAPLHQKLERIHHSGGIYALASMDRYVYSASNDFTVLEWDQMTYDFTGRIIGKHKNQVRCLCLCYEHILSGSDDHKIGVWDTAKAEAVRMIHHTDCVLALAHVPGADAFFDDDDDNKASQDTIWCGDGTGVVSIYSWSENAALKSQLIGHTGPISCLLREHSVVFSAAADKTIRVWDAVKWTCLQTLNSHASYVTSLAILAHDVRSRLWTFSGDKTIRTWNLEVRGPPEDSSEAMWNRATRFSRKAKSVEDNIAACKSAEMAARSEADFLREQVENAAQLRRDSEHVLQSRFEELSSRANALELELEQTKLLLEKERTRAAQAENSVTQSDELCASFAKVLAAKEAELSDVKVKSDAAKEKNFALEQDLSHGLVERHELRRQLRETRESSEMSERRCQQMQQALDEVEQQKLSRLAFTAEVWALQKIVTEAKKGTMAWLRGRPPMGVNVQAWTNVQRSVEPTVDSLTRAHEQSTKIICKFLTDEEKLHLGIPLALFEGGHDTPKPLAWGEGRHTSHSPGRFSTDQIKSQLWKDRESLSPPPGPAASALEFQVDGMFASASTGTASTKEDQPNYGPSASTVRMSGGSNRSPRARSLSASPIGGMATVPLSPRTMGSAAAPVTTRDPKASGSLAPKTPRGKSRVLMVRANKAAWSAF